MLGLIIVCLSLIAQAQECATITKNLPDIIELPADNSRVAVKFERGAPGIVLTGGAGISADLHPVTDSPFDEALKINSFGEGSYNSAACQSARSSTLISVIALLFGALGVVGLKRAEPFLLVVLCLCAIPFASSACSATISVRGSDTMAFEGDVKSRLIVTCPQGGIPFVAVSTKNITFVECPYLARYSLVWSSNTNAASCATIAPGNVMVEKRVDSDDGVIHFGELELTSVNNYTLRRELANELGRGVPLQDPTTIFSQVRVVAGGPLLDLALQNIAANARTKVKAVPVIIRRGEDICKFGYMCQEGSCTYPIDFPSSDPNVCVEYGFEDPVPTSCSNRGNGTGTSCGIECKSLTCTTMCPGAGNDCSMARACLATDTNAYPCQQCQCPEAPCSFNSAKSLSSGGILLVVFGIMLLQ